MIMKGVFYKIVNPGIMLKPQQGKNSTCGLNLDLARVLTLGQAQLILEAWHGENALGLMRAHGPRIEKAGSLAGSGRR